MPSEYSISYATIGRIERGDQDVTLSQLRLLAEALGVSVVDLIEDSNTDPEMVDLLERLTPSEKQIALKMLKGLVSDEKET